jgi:hypothetical protein
VKLMNGYEREKNETFSVQFFCLIFDVSVAVWSTEYLN